MKLKRTIISALAGGLCLMMMTSAALATDLTKNETVYAALNGDGSVNRIYVVNQLTGKYVDYGTYSEIKNLSTTSVPDVAGDRIAFPDEPVEGGLYYQGTMTGELPMTFSISYELDGQKVTADQLSGASGHLVMTLRAAQNMQCSEAVRDGLMAQIAAKLNTKYAANITVANSTVVAVGKTVSVSCMVLPGEDNIMRVEADIQDFQMEPITITLLKGTLVSTGINEKLDEYDDGFDEMIDGTNSMVDGTTELKDGMTTLADGLGSLSSGLGRLSAGGKELHNGMKRYGDNLSEYLSGVQSIVQPSADVKAGLSGIADNGAAVAHGVSDISGGLNALSSSSADLKALAQSLAGSDDPEVAALAAGTLQTLAALNKASDGLAAASEGLDAYVNGVQQTAAGYGHFHSGLTELADGGSRLNSAFDSMLSGISDYSNGVSKSASGAKKIYNSVRGLPDDIQSLIDGQIEFKDGIVSAKEEMNKTTSMFIAADEPPVSFASPEKNHPDSVQYILTTPAIEKMEKTEPQQQETLQQNFFTRFAALFR